MYYLFGWDAELRMQTRFLPNSFTRKAVRERCFPICKGAPRSSGGMHLYQTQSHPGVQKNPRDLRTSNKFQKTW